MSRMKRVVRLFFHAAAHEVFQMPCDSGINTTLLDDEGLCVLSSETLSKEAGAAAALLGLNTDNKQYIDAIAAGEAIGVVISHLGEPVHYGFLYLKNRTHRLLGLPKDGALMGNAFTVESYRGKGCQARSVGIRAQLASDAGFERVYAETGLDNDASKRGLSKAGMEYVGRIRIVVLLRCMVLRHCQPRFSRAVAICLGN